jgi:hypothetical protein
VTLDPRQDLFCRLVANGATPATAARMIGYADPAAGETLLAEPGMGERVATLSAAREAGHAAMFERLEAWLSHLVEHSIANGQTGHALRAIDRLMQLHGMNGKGNGRLPAIEPVKPTPAPILDDLDLATLLPSAVDPEPQLNRRERRALKSMARRK